MTTAGWPSIVAVLREQLGSMRNIPRPPVAYPAGTIGNRWRPLSASLAEHGRCLRDALSWLGSRCRPLSATACAAACCWGVYSIRAVGGIRRPCPPVKKTTTKNEQNKKKRRTNDHRRPSLRERSPVKEKGTQHLHGLVVLLEEICLLCLLRAEMVDGKTSLVRPRAEL